MTTLTDFRKTVELRGSARACFGNGLTDVEETPKS